jgi:protein TonB
VFGVCDEGAKCPPLPDIEGVTAGDVARGLTVKVISKPQPAYPPIARAARAQGKVTVQVVVSEEGKVIAAQAVSGHPLLQAAAVKAAREALFSPVLLGTKPVKLSGVITYNFVLQ